MGGEVAFEQRPWKDEDGDVQTSGGKAFPQEQHMRGLSRVPGIAEAVVAGRHVGGREDEEGARRYRDADSNRASPPGTPAHSEDDASTGLASSHSHGSPAHTSAAPASPSPPAGLDRISE